MSFLVFFLPLWPSHQVKALHAACCLLEALIYTGYKKTQFSSFLFSFYSPFYWISQFTYICEKNTSAPWRTSPTPCCHYEMLNLLRSIEEYTSKCARGTNTVITRQSLEIKALELSSKSSTSMSKVSKTSYRWVSKCVHGLSENVKKDPHTIYLIFSSFSSNMTSVIQWDAECEAASFHLKSIRPHAGREVEALWAPTPRPRRRYPSRTSPRWDRTRKVASADLFLSH